MIKLLKPYLLIFICCLCWANADAQTKIDTLKTKLQNHLAFDTGKVLLLNDLGFEYWIVDPKKSVNYGYQALELAKLIQYPPGQARAFRIIGVGHWALGEYDLALQNLYQSLDAFESLEDALGQGNAHLNIGMVYGDQKKYDRAFDELNKAEYIFRNVANDSRVATTYTKRGTYLAETKKYDEAYEYYIKSLKIHELAGFTYGISEVNNRLGILFKEKASFDKSLSYLFRSLEAGESINDQYGVSDNYLQIGEVYFLKKDFTQAEIYLQKGLQIAKTLGIKSTERDLYLALKELESARGNVAGSLMYFEKYVAQKDSLFNEVIANRISVLETTHATIQQEKELKIAQQEVKILEQQNALGQYLRSGLIFGLVILCGLGYFIFRYLRLKIKAKEVLVENEKYLRQQENEISTMNAQIAEKENQTLKKELETSQRKLTSYTINFIRKNELLDEAKSEIYLIQKNTANKVLKDQLKQVTKNLNEALNFDQDWDDFRWHFEKVHPNFFQRLLKKTPDLSKNDFKLCALSQMNLSIKEMSSILGISPDSVKTARSRLRKKLNITRDLSIYDFLNQS